MPMMPSNSNGPSGGTTSTGRPLSISTASSRLGTHGITGDVGLCRHDEIGDPPARRYDVSFLAADNVKFGVTARARHTGFADGHCMPTTRLFEGLTRNGRALLRLAQAHEHQLAHPRLLHVLPFGIEELWRLRSVKGLDAGAESLGDRGHRFKRTVILRLNR